MTDLSVIIPARNEEFLQRTIDDVLSKIKGDTEVIAILDGYWPEPGIVNHPNLKLIHHTKLIGQRAATNEGARLSEAKYIMKLDAHCSVSEGFDVELMKNCEYDWTVIPRMYTLHVFSWVCKNCGEEYYQGPTKTEECSKCHYTDYERKIVWKPNRQTDYMWFTRDLKVKYFDGNGLREYGDNLNEVKKKYGHKYRDWAKSNITDVLNGVGACWFMHRQRFFDIDGLDENHGSWGQMGVEIAMKTWLSGGRHVVNKNAWFAHLFRTQGKGFSFPYENPGKAQEYAHEYSKNLWLNNGWAKQKRSLGWLIEKFGPLPGWEDYGDSFIDQKVKKLKESINEIKKDKSKRIKPEPRYDEVFEDGVKWIDLVDNKITKEIIDKPLVKIHSWAKYAKQKNRPKKKPTIGMVYYTNNQCEERITNVVRNHLKAACNGHQLVSVSQHPINFGENIVTKLRSSPLSMFKQILVGLKKVQVDIVFLVEHDVIYHKSHFNFIPEKEDVYYYNENVWKVCSKTGQALFYHTKQTSGLCAYRDLLIEHYKKRIERVEQEGFTRKMGFEPGTHKFPQGIDNYKSESYMSEYPNIDIRHKSNLTANRFKKEQFRSEKSIQGWTLADEVPGWGVTKNRFDDFIYGVADGNN